MKKSMFILVILCGGFFVYAMVDNASNLIEAGTATAVFTAVITCMSVYGFAIYAKALAPESKNERDERLYLSHNLGQLNAFLSGRKGM